MAERPGEMDERDVDERFASIVARWEGADPAPQDTASPASQDATSSTSQDATSPAATPVTEPPAPDGSAAPRPGPGPASLPGVVPLPEAADDSGAAPSSPPRGTWVNPSPLERVVPETSWRAPTPADDETRAAASAAEAELEDEHFEPPDVTLPPQEDLHFWGAVIGLVAGPLMLLYVVFARPFHSTRWFVVSVVVSLLGFALLVLRQPTNRDEHDSDNGARI